MNTTPRLPVMPALLSVKDTAIYLGVSRSTVYKLSAQCGTGPAALPVVYIGRKRLFRVADLDRLIERSVAHGGRQPPVKAGRQE
jgi:excisionase family DNA binding protein